MSGALKSKVKESPFDAKLQVMVCGAHAVVLWIEEWAVSRC